MSKKRLNPDTLCYLDNAATSFPKPESVPRALAESLQSMGNPGRGGHRLSLKADRLLFEAREKIARLFTNPLSQNIVFSKNATESINLVIKGLLQPGDHALVSRVEHNAVIRPLKALAATGVTFTGIGCDPQGCLDVEALGKAIRPETKLIAMTHASNVTGAILPIREVGRIARERRIPFLVDAAQTAGVLEIDMQRDGIDLLACTGHKGLLGPQGIGFLSMREGIPLKPLIHGGTGSHSDSMEQPDFLPDKFESGTQNSPGIAGLFAGIEFIEREGMGNIREKEKKMTGQLLEGLSEMDSVEIFGPLDPERQIAVVSFRVRGRDSGEIGEVLDSEYGIITRVGLHCSPMAHQSIGTFPQGTIRVSPGYFTTESEIDYLLDSLKEICKSTPGG